MALPFVTNVALVQPHRGYQALAGFAMAAASALAVAEARLFPARESASTRRAMRISGLAAAGIVVALVAVDVAAGRVWRDEVSFWARAVVRYPDDASYRHSLGAARFRAGDSVGAIADLSRALALDPELPRAAYNLGVAYTRLGRRDEAIAAFERAVVRDAADVKAWSNLGRLLETRGDATRALAAYRTALGIAPQVTAIRDRIAALEAAHITGLPATGRP
jgi:Flp pilus assembly protein TadD